MVHGTVRHFFQIIGAFGLILFGVAPLLAWRISSAPLNLDFLTPYVEDALTPPDHSYTVKLDGTVLFWNVNQRMLDVRAVGVKIAAADGTIVAVVPALSLGLSVHALSAGMIAPRTITLADSRLRLLRRTDGRIEVDLGGPTPVTSVEGAWTHLLEKALAAPDNSRPTGYLSRFHLLDAKITVEDQALETTWTVDNVDLMLMRNKQGISVEGAFSVVTPDGPARFDVEGKYLAADRKITLHGKFAGIRPSSFSKVAPLLDMPARIDLPISGEVDVNLDSDGNLRHANFDISATAGTLHLLDPVANSYDIRGFKAKGVVEGVALLTLDSLLIDLGGPKIIASAKLERVLLSGEIIASGKAKITDMPMDTLPKHWPPTIAPKPRKWIAASLHDGVIPVADFSVAARGVDLKHLKLDRFVGDLSVHGVTVDYLTPMPLVRKGDADVHFTPDRITIGVKKGSLTGLNITKGTVTITGMDQDDQNGDIDLFISGPVRDALALVDSKPLGYASKLGFSSSRSGGDSITHLTLKFPMAEDLSLEKIDVLAVAQLKNLFLGNVVFGKNLTKGAVDLRVDRKAITVRGMASLGDTPLNLEWEESFVRSTEFRSRYQISGVLDDQQRVAFGLDFQPLIPPFMSGPLQTKMVITLGHNGRGVALAEADLAGIQMSLPGINWSKQADIPGHAEVSLRFADGKVTDVPSFTAKVGSDLDIRGDVVVTDAGAPRRVDFTMLKVGRTDVKGTLDLAANGGLTFKMHGPIFDLAPILSAGQEAETSPPAPNMQPLEIELSADRLWMSENGHFDHAVVSITRKGGVLTRASLDAVVTPVDEADLTLKNAPTKESKPVTLRLNPGAPDRLFTVASEDAGGVIRALGIFETMIGGKLEIKGTIDTSDMMKGACLISDYRVIKAPLLTRLLTVAALTGILESLTGEGLRFTNFEMPFTRSNGVLTITDAQASGPSLGLTAKGKVLTAKGRIDVEGTIVPAYAINSLLGKIPLLGELLTGEKGGGIFAATYSIKGPMVEPDVSVNPLAVLTPGLLRKLFHAFDDKDDPIEPDVEKKANAKVEQKDLP